jgi:ketosteroid isomerase-like protein
VIRGSRHYWGTWDDYSVEAEELLEAGPSVVVILRESGCGKESGAPFEQTHPQLWTFRGDRIIRWDSFQTRAEALEAVA